MGFGCPVHGCTVHPTQSPIVIQGKGAMPPMPKTFIFWTSPKLFWSSANMSSFRGKKQNKSQISWQPMNTQQPNFWLVVHILPLYFPWGKHVETNHWSFDLYLKFPNFVPCSQWKYVFFLLQIWLLCNLAKLTSSYALVGILGNHQKKKRSLLRDGIFLKGLCRVSTLIGLIWRIKRRHEDGSENFLNIVFGEGLR